MNNTGRTLGYTSRRLGYARVSTTHQNYDAQVAALEKAGCTYVFKEKESAKNENRYEYQRLLEEVKPGDTIVVNSLDRFVRSTRDLLNTLEKLEQKGVILKSLKEGESVIDTSTSTGKFMLTVLGAVAEMERSLLLERQKNGIAKAKALGKYKGSEAIPTPDNFEEIFNLCYLEENLNKKISAVVAMDRLKLKKSTFYKKVGEHLEKNPHLKDHPNLSSFNKNENKNILEELARQEKENREMREQLEQLKTSQTSTPIEPPSQPYSQQLPPGMPAMGKAPTMTNNESGVKGF